MSTENVVADSWEDADADPLKELMDKMEKVKILQRKEQKKEQFFEKVKAEENGGSLPKLQTEDGSVPITDEPKRIVLRRPKDGFVAETVEDVVPSSGDFPDATQNQNDRIRILQKSVQKDPKQPAQTFEQRQAAYQAARERILGSEYKPDNQEIKEIKFIDRSKSPETLRMTQQNMVEHYGEELSRELMEQPAEPVVNPELPFAPDFSQPPPNILPQEGVADVYNGPPGFQMHHQNFQQHQYMENAYFQQVNNAPSMGVHYIPGYPAQYEPSAMSSSSQNNQNDGKNEPVYYFSQPSTQQVHNQMNYMPFQLPNMSYPPPTFLPHQNHTNQSQPLMQQQQAQMMQMQQSQQMNQYYPMSNSSNHGPRSAIPNNKQTQQMPRQEQFFQINSGVKPVPLMQTKIMSKNSGVQGGQQRFQTQQNGQVYVQNQNNQNRKGNGKNCNGNGKNVPQLNNFSVPPPFQPGQNPIPFGCPPRHVNAIREQCAKPPNTGAGLLGPHPLMQWNEPPPSIQQNRQQ